MTRTTHGSCLCGRVTFRVAGDFESFFLCHCSRCRKDTGSAHAANLFSSTAELTWLSGHDCVKNHRLSETRHERNFCSECGSALPSVQMQGRLVVVPAGSVDSELDIKPDAHICYASRANWDNRLKDVPKVDGLPG